MSSSRASTSIGATGQDASRATMTAAFSAVIPAASPATAALEAALEYHRHGGGRAGIAPYTPEHLARLRRLLDDSIALDRAWHTLNGRASGAAASTVETLVFSLRSRGVQALGEPDVLRRLAQLDNAQLREVAVRLQKLKPHIAPAWAPKDVEVLLAVRSKV